MTKALRYLPLLSVFIFTIFPSVSKAQEFLGFSGSNYAGINRVIVQPAAVVDSRFAFDLNLVSGSTTLSNNYLKVDLKELARNGVPEFDSTYGFQDYRFDNILQKTNSKTKNIYIGQDVLGPSFMVQVDRKNAFAITTRARAMLNVDNFLKDFVDLGLAEFADSTLYNQTFTLNSSRISAMAWGEIGATYGRVVYNEEEHFLKAGITAKYLMGFASFYLYNEDVEVVFFDSDSLSVNEPTVTANNAVFRTGLSDNIPVNGGDYTNTVAGRGFGLDFGVVYEYRPDYADYLVAGEDGDEEMRNKNKYMIRAEFAMLDLGSIKFTKHPETYDFGLNWQNYNVADIQVDEDGNWLDSLGVTRLGDDERTYRMNLPTSYMLAVDYKPFKDVDFYVNGTAFMATRNYKNENKVRDISRFTLTPRYEMKWLGIGIPLSYNSFGYGTVGTYLHLGPFFVGSMDVWNYLLTGKVQGFNMYGGMKVPIPYGKKKDRDKDKDGVVDKLDECIDVAGPVENKGCPYGDKDEDGLLDNVDECIDVPGPKENNGCPYGDKDEDGVLDNEDECITTPGPVENKGCPYGDKDGDLVLDGDDECIDVAGPAENNGCPWPDKDQDGVFDKEDDCIDAPGPKENNGCPYLDTDGDGVLDKDDQCPKTPGVAENNGCPVLKKEEEAIVKRAFDNLEFDSGKDVIRYSSFSALDELADLLIKNPNWGLKLAGHTDNVGSETANMKLSRDRAMAVKNYLVSKGANGDVIKVEYYGASKPIADNATPGGRQMNRRVEMEIVFE